MKINKIFTAGLFLVLGLSLFSCNLEGDNYEGQTVVINAYNENKELITQEVKKNPTRIVTLDMAALDIIDTLNEGARVVGSATTTIEYLEVYFSDKNCNIINTGTVKVADFEAVYEANPDMIFIGGRLSISYKELSKIATTVYLSADISDGLVNGTKELAYEIGKIFGKEKLVNSLVNEYNEKISALNSISLNQNALVTMVSGTSASVLTNSGRCSLIGLEVGFNNLGSTAADSTHGDSVSFEYFVALDPEYIFVLDRNSVTGDTNNVKDVIENSIVKETKAYKNGNIIYLNNSNVWYTAEGGIRELGIMIGDLENSLIK